MLTYNDQAKARFPLSLDGRGARGEGVCAAFLLGCAALLAAPQAVAQCTTPTGTEAAPAPASGTVTCQPGDYADGMHFDSTGDLSLQVPDGFFDLTVNDGGANVTGQGGDNVSWDSGAFTGDVVGTDGAVIDYESLDGDISIITGKNVIGEGDATHVIRAHVTGDGNIVIEPGVGSSGLENIDLRDSSSAETAIEAITQDGNISITTDEVGVLAGAGTHGILAESAGGNIDIETRGSVVASGSAIRAESTGDVSIFHNVVRNIRSDNATAIEAISNGGDVTVIGGDGTIEGFERGIFADASSGTGELLLDIGAEVLADANAGIAAVDAVSGTGPMTINIRDGAEIDGGAGAAIRADAGGDAQINFFGGSELAFGDDASGVHMTAAADTTTTVNFGRLGEPSTADTTMLGGAGAGEIVVNNNATAAFGGLWGGVDFSANEGGVIFNNAAAGGGWSFSGAGHSFSAGDDTVHNADLILPASAAVDVPHTQDDREFVESVIDFGAGHDVFANAGTIVVGEGRFTYSLAGGNPQMDVDSVNVASEARFENLDEFNNSGLIVLGGWVFQGDHSLVPSPANRFYLSPANDALCEAAMNGVPCLEQSQTLKDTDRLANDVLAMPGAMFTGSGASTILLDAALSRGRAQSGCTRRGGVDDDFNLPAADCVDLSGGGTAGSTEIIVRDVTSSTLGAYYPEGIVIVDVSGGESSAEHFTLSPASHNYDPATGAIDTGLFLFPLVYDQANQQHKLASMLSQTAMQMPLLVQAAQQISRTAGGGWFDRQNDLRGNRDNVDYGGTWGRLVYEAGEREARQTQSAFDTELSYDNSFEQDTTTVTVGQDFVFGNTGERAWVVGGTLGYVRSKAAFDETPSRVDLDGANVGVYGSYFAGPWFVDATLNHAWLTGDGDFPSLNLASIRSLTPREIQSGTIIEFSEETLLADDTVFDIRARTLGARLESGWRLNLSQALHVEPLAALSWVRADFDGMDVASADAAGQPDNTVFGGNASTSLRAGLGGRLGFEQPLQSVRLNYALTARVWEELDGETDVRIASTGPDATITDEFDGTFSEVQAGIGISNLSGSVSGTLSANGTFHEDYESVGAEVGFRYQW